MASITRRRHHVVIRRLGRRVQRAESQSPASELPPPLAGFAGQAGERREGGERHRRDSLLVTRRLDRGVRPPCRHPPARPADPAGNERTSTVGRCHALRLDSPPSRRMTRRKGVTRRHHLIATRAIRAASRSSPPSGLTAGARRRRSGTRLPVPGIRPSACLEGGIVAQALGRFWPGGVAGRPVCRPHGSAGDV